MPNLHPQEVDTPNYQNGSTKLLAFHLPGLGFWIFVMIKWPLEPHCKIIFSRMGVAAHLFSEISCHHSSDSFTLYFIVFVHFHSLIENCLLLYICVYGCISDTFLLYYWIFAISLCIFFIISPLSFRAENNLDQWYQSRLLLIVFFSVHVPDEVWV